MGRRTLCAQQKGKELVLNGAIEMGWLLWLPRWG